MGISKQLSVKFTFLALLILNYMFHIKIFFGTTSALIWPAYPKDVDVKGAVK